MEDDVVCQKLLKHKLEKHVVIFFFIYVGPDHVQLTFGLKVICRLKANWGAVSQFFLQLTLL